MMSLKGSGSDIFKVLSRGGPGRTGKTLLAGFPAEF